MDPDVLVKLKRTREKAVNRFLELTELDDDKIDVTDSQQLVWSFLKPLKPSIERIVYSKERYPAQKERAKILGAEIRNFGNHIRNLRKGRDGEELEKIGSLEPQFW